MTTDMPTSADSEVQTDEDEEVRGYARVSTSDQSRERQVDTITEKYPNATMYADIGHGDDATREQWQELRTEIEEGDVDLVACHTVDRLGRSTAELAEFIDYCRENDVAIDAIADGVTTKGDMGDIMMKMLALFAEVELRYNRERRKEGIERAISEGKQFGEAPHGMRKNEMGVAVPAEGFERVQAFIREVKKGRSKRPTARFFEVPEGSIASILENADKHYGVAFNNDEWKVRNAKVQTGEIELEPLGEKYPEQADDRESDDGE